MQYVYHTLQEDIKSIYAFIPQNASLVDELAETMDCITKIEKDIKNNGWSQVSVARCKKLVTESLIVTEVSRLSRTLTDLMAIMGKCLEKGINLYTTKEGYSFDNSINSKVLCFAFGLVAEIERNLISMRTKEALALRKAEGVVLGRKKGSYTKMNVLIENRKVIVGMLKRNCTIADICRRFDISRDTFMKFRSRYKEIDKAMKEKEIRRKGELQKRRV
jgi:DNA invertase Pin-like site-specific DNA recombinase